MSKKAKKTVKPAAKKPAKKTPKPAKKTNKVVSILPASKTEEVMDPEKVEKFQRQVTAEVNEMISAHILTEDLLKRLEVAGADLPLRKIVVEEMVKKIWDKASDCGWSNCIDECHEGIWSDGFDAAWEDAWDEGFSNGFDCALEGVAKGEIVSQMIDGEMEVEFLKTDEEDDSEIEVKLLEETKASAEAVS